MMVNYRGSTREEEFTKNLATGSYHEKFKIGKILTPCIRTIWVRIIASKDCLTRPKVAILLDFN